MKILTFCFVILLLSCTNKKITYSYDDTIVTRIDKDGEVTFYYGDLEDSTNEHPFIRASYSGFNSGVDAFLKFNDDRTVELIHYGMGSFTQSDKGNSKIYMKDYENPELDSLIKSYGENYQNLIRVSDVIKIERKRNFENRSQVVAKYE